ncbi:Imm63 family immunity protein [Fulvivirga lutea]|uniref:Immunity protein 63 domain-containing protein n=1 Tax=Fulvivirga lutea TaxID=2810512 RepID=A0A974WIK1_9BACT|nr:Imm63 family immunity protein [Fulvivirga lutea]QSE99208.1 hypothetical protein JR347_09000 [Fulvivirga lutea]
MALIINAPSDYLPTYNTPKGDGHPCVKIEGSKFYLVYEESGIEHERKLAKDLNELMYYVFDDITYLMASDYELKNRESGEDPRKKLLEKQLELMNKISIPFAERLRTRISNILRVSPYRKPPKFLI